MNISNIRRGKEESLNKKKLTKKRREVEKHISQEQYIKKKQRKDGYST